ncbi:MAG: TolC family protein, partial [Treponema sp.]|nr:TolC family protein [Treponema sp.]
MKKTAGFCMFFSMILSIHTSVSSDVPESPALSLERIRLLALANSRSLARYNLAIESSLLDEKARNFTYLPSLSLTGAASMKLWDTGGGAMLDSLGAGAALEISETLPLYDG